MMGSLHVDSASPHKIVRAFTDTSTHVWRVQEGL